MSGPPALAADCQRSIIVGDKPAPAPGSGEVPAGVKLLMEVSKRGQGEDMAQKEATRTLANLCMVREGALPAPVSTATRVAASAPVLSAHSSIPAPYSFPAAEALEMLRASGVSDLFQRLLDNTQSGSLTMQAHLAMANLDPPPLSMEHGAHIPPCLSPCPRTLSLTVPPPCPAHSPEHFRATPMYDMIHDFVAVTEQTNPQLQCKAAGALAVLAQACASRRLPLLPQRSTALWLSSHRQLPAHHPSPPQRARTSR